MATVSIIHYTHKKNLNGTSPIIIQVHDGKRYKKSIASILPKQWNDEKKRVIPKSHPNYATINIRISEEYNRIEQLILSGKFDIERDFIKYFKNETNSDTEKNKEKTFSEIIPLYVSSLKSGFSMLAYGARLNYFAREAGVENLPLSKITRAHMDKFIKYMEAKGNKRSTMRTQLKIVRFLSSYAESAGISQRNPVLHNFPLPVAERSYKGKLDKDELIKFAAHDVGEDKLAAEMKDMFLLAVYLRGMRIGDVIQLKQEYFKNGRLIYESGKNKKTFNIKLIEAAASIVNKYLDGREYLFTLFKYRENDSLTYEENLKIRANHIRSITAHVNKKLKEISGDAGIEKNISTHIARHTFAKMAIEKVKDINLSMDLVGHSNIKEHQLYIREISETEDLDEAADSIFS